MYDKDKDDLAIFEFYRKLPLEARVDCEVFITPEKIYKIQYASEIDIDDLERKLENLRNMKTEEIVDILESQSSYLTTFTRVVDAIREYLQLRPQMIEKYPEYLL